LSRDEIVSKVEQLKADQKDTFETYSKIIARYEKLLENMKEKEDASNKA
jgi:uncharacterized coiled-coil DUF342 family protein